MNEFVRGIPEPEKEPSLQAEIGLVFGYFQKKVQIKNEFENEKLENEASDDPDYVKENQRIYGNTSGSSVPLALDTLYRQGNLKEMDLVILLGFGAGFTYAANLIWWTKEYKG